MREVQKSEMTQDGRAKKMLLLSTKESVRFSVKQNDILGVGRSTRAHVICDVILCHIMMSQLV